MRSAWLNQTSRKVFFFIIFLQLPLFRVPCRTGVCTTPLQITALQLAISKVIPLQVVKALLYPGACFQNLVTDLRLPSWSTLLEEYKLTNSASSEATEFHRLEVLAGSYFAVAGALVALVKPGRMSLFGTLLLIWGLIREGLFSSNKQSDIYVYPTMLLALVSAFLSVKYDIQKVQNLAKPIARPLKDSNKSKLK